MIELVMDAQPKLRNLETWIWGGGSLLYISIIGLKNATLKEIMREMHYKMHRPKLRVQAAGAV